MKQLIMRTLIWGIKLSCLLMLLIRGQSKLFATTLLVPSQYPTIQAAMNAAPSSGASTVLVSPGTYPEILDFNGKAISLVGVGGPSQTILVPAAGQNGVSFANSETSSSVLTGFTINGSAGGITAIFCHGSAPVIASNVFLNCNHGLYCSSAGNVTIFSNYFTGGSSTVIYSEFSGNLLIQSNIIVSNNGSISANYSTTLNIFNNFILNNHANGIDSGIYSTINVLQNVLVGNTGTAISSATSGGDRGPVCVNNTIFGNGAGFNFNGPQGFSGSGTQVINNIVVGPYCISVDSTSPLMVANNDFYDYGTNPYSAKLGNLTGSYGNISADPLFVCGITGDLQILLNSPAVNAGSNAAPLLTTSDILGNPRVMSGTIDMGAYEADPGVPLLPCLYVNCPGNIVAIAGTNQPGAVVTFPPPTGTPGATLLSVPASGSSFPVGTNTVKCTARYGLGSATCSFTITVLAPPVLTNLVVITNVLSGQNFTLQVTPSGSAPFTYQWYQYNTAIAGATNNPLTITNAQPVNEGTYSVTVFNSAGVASNIVAIARIVPTAPSIVSNPASMRLPAGTNAIFTVNALGSMPLIYQWFFNNGTLDGATNAQYTISNLQSSNAGNYQVVVSNSLGSVTSSVARLTVDMNPIITIGLTNQVVDVGNSVVLSASAIGTQPLSYSWQLNGATIAGSNATLTISNIQTSQSGFYSLTVTNQYASASTTSRVSVLGMPGTPWIWGDNSGGQANVPTNLGQVVAVAGGDYHSIGLHRDGTVVGWGYNANGQISVPANSPQIVAIAAGAAHNLAVTPDGTIMAWGDNDSGQCNVPFGLASNVLAVAAGDSHSLALLNTGSVIAWGDDTFGQIEVPWSLIGVKAIAAGRYHSLALVTNGTVVAWGYNARAQTMAPANLTNAMAITAGYLHSAALTSNRTVVCWGDNTFGQCNVPASATNILSIAAGDFHMTALRADGTLISWGDDHLGQLDFPQGLKKVLGIASGNYHSLALLPGVGPLFISASKGNAVINWYGSGVLQSSPGITGPFTDVTGIQGSQYTVTNHPGASRFFRLRQ